MMLLLLGFLLGEYASAQGTILLTQSAGWAMMASRPFRLVVRQYNDLEHVSVNIILVERDSEPTCPPV